ncbi:MAG: hypothetical protein ACXVBW_11120 [Bdellovibrionota bacterium]
MARIKNAEGRSFRVTPSDGSPPFNGTFILNEKKNLKNADGYVIMLDKVYKERRVPIRDLVDPKAIVENGGQSTAVVAGERDVVVEPEPLPPPPHELRPDAPRQVAGKIPRSYPPLHDSERPMDFIQDKNILTVHEPIDMDMLPNPGHHDIPVFVTKEHRHVIQRLTPRDSTAAVTAMLIRDHGRMPAVAELVNRRMGNIEMMKTDLMKAKLTPKIPHVMTGSNDSINQTLSALINRNGSIAVKVNGEIGESWIIVDKVDLVKGKARIREPHHGWDITITLQELDRKLGNKIESLQVGEKR